MGLEHHEDRLRAALRDAGLRCTQPRLEVLAVLGAAEGPLSHREVADLLGAHDQATVFRNLVTLSDAGLARRLDVGDHVWRYEAAGSAHGAGVAGHAHFTCAVCGDVTCLDDVQIQVGNEVSLPPSIAEAEVQLRGVCEECR